MISHQKILALAKRDMSSNGGLPRWFDRPGPEVQGQGDLTCQLNDVVDGSEGLALHHIDLSLDRRRSINILSADTLYISLASPSLGSSLLVF